MKPEYIGYGKFDESKYVYAYCMCPLPTSYAIKFKRILDRNPHVYECVCEDCKTQIKIRG